MNTFVAALEEQFKYKFTENGAIALSTTGSKVYDMFAFGAAYRQRGEGECVLLFKQAYEEDPSLALKCLFYIRDCRGGQGERRFFRVCLHWLARTYPMVAADLINYVPEYGRYDDLFALFNTPIESNVLKFVTNQLTKDMESIALGGKQAVSLLAKWMPSENTHSYETKQKAKKIRYFIGLTSKEYRKILSELRERINVLERLMSTNRWEEIEFDKIPSKAGLIYRNAFARRDLIAAKYEEFIKDKNTKVNADTLYPYDVVNKALDIYPRDFSINREVVNKYWENLPDYFEGKEASMLCVVDTSGSMTWRTDRNITPINVSISLGMYCAEHIKGHFANQFITFSRQPKLVKIEGVDFVDKVHKIYHQSINENTNLAGVFTLLENTIRKYNVKKEDIPKTIVIVSDMEIDRATDYNGIAVSTIMDKIRARWNHLGLTLPKLVYWNVAARNNTILDEGPGITFVSGCSPVVFKQVITGKTGVELMLEILLSERYKNIGL